MLGSDLNKQILSQSSCQQPFMRRICSVTQDTHMTKPSNSRLVVVCRTVSAASPATVQYSRSAPEWVEQFCAASHNSVYAYKSERQQQATTLISVQMCKSVCQQQQHRTRSMGRFKSVLESIVAHFQTVFTQYSTQSQQTLAL